MFYFLFVSVVWGITWIAIGQQFHSVDTFAAVFYRFLAASLILFLFVKFKKLPLKFNKELHLLFLAQGLFLFCLNYQLNYWGSSLAPSALMALGFTSLTYFNMFGAWVFLKIPIERKVLAGACLSLLGMIFISYNELIGQSLHPTSLVGFLLSLVATVSASTGNLIALKARNKKIPIASNNAWGMFYGSVFSLIFCLAAHKSLEIKSFDPSFVIAFLYLVIFGTVLSFGAYIKMIETLGPSKAAFTSVVSPVVAVCISITFENFQVTWLLFAGIIFCLLGNVVALSPKNLLKK